LEERKVRKVPGVGLRVYKTIMRTVEINKACLIAFDDKRYILDDGVTTLAYGHKDIHT